MRKEKAIDILRELTSVKEAKYDEEGNMVSDMKYSVEEYQEAVEVFSDTINQNDEMKNKIKVLEKEAEFHKAEEKTNIVTVRWFDGYIEVFEATEVRISSDLLWMRLKDGNNRHIPMRNVRWFGASIESHQKTEIQAILGVPERF